MNHLPDDTKLLRFNSRVKSINEGVNYDLKNLSNWLKANKISLNLGKTVLFTSFYFILKPMEDIQCL